MVMQYLGRRAGGRIRRSMFGPNAREQQAESQMGLTEAQKGYYEEQTSASQADTVRKEYENKRETTKLAVTQFFDMMNHLTPDMRKEFARVFTKTQLAKDMEKYGIPYDERIWGTMASDTELKGQESYLTEEGKLRAGRENIQALIAKPIPLTSSATFNRPISADLSGQGGPAAPQGMGQSYLELQTAQSQPPPTAYQQALTEESRTRAEVLRRGKGEEPVQIVGRPYEFRDPETGEKHIYTQMSDGTIVDRGKVDPEDAYNWADVWTLLSNPQRGHVITTTGKNWRGKETETEVPFTEATEEEQFEEVTRFQKLLNKQVKKAQGAEGAKKPTGSPIVREEGDKYIVRGKDGKLYPVPKSKYNPEDW